MKTIWTKQSVAEAIRKLATQKNEGFLSPLSTDSISLLKHVEADYLETLPGKGLAHDHVSIRGTDLLLRIPKQSQMKLSAHENLRYQAACFERMQASMHTPICYATLAPTSHLQMGALLVQRIYGRYAESVDDIHLIAETLASIHRLPLTPVHGRAPLFDQKHPMSETLTEVKAQAQYLTQAELSLESLSMIESELKLAHDDLNRLPPSPVTLISFDAHPGNFLIDASDKAILVDLEKARYSGAGLDLAHASLYTSTTWDSDVNIKLSKKHVFDFYAIWSREVGEELAKLTQAYLIPMRRLMWLWSVSWCAKWQVESLSLTKNAKHIANNTEDWSVDNNPEKLVQHVNERVKHYLQQDVISRICEEFATLSK